MEKQICWKHLAGLCRYGLQCPNQHDWALVGEVCKYFEEGSCWYGDSCRYLHLPWVDANRHGPLHEVESSAPSGAVRPSVAPARCIQVAERQGLSYFNWDLPHAAKDGEKNMDAAAEPVHEDWQQSPPFNLVFGQKLRAPKAQQYVATNEQSTDAITPPLFWRLEAYQQSKDVVCGICLEKVYDKPIPKERRFAILPKCNHSFCIGCIMQWRKVKDFQQDVTKSCPQCRVKSGFYIPSDYWVCGGQQKETLIASFKEKCSKIKCKFFMCYQDCPFKSDCIFSHELPRGHRPRRHVRRRRAEEYLHYERLAEDSMLWFCLSS